MKAQADLLTVNVEFFDILVVIIQQSLQPCGLNFMDAAAERIIQGQISILQKIIAAVSNTEFTHQCMELETEDLRKMFVKYSLCEEVNIINKGHQVNDVLCYVQAYMNGK